MPYVVYNIRVERGRLSGGRFVVYKLPDTAGIEKWKGDLPNGILKLTILSPHCSHDLSCTRKRSGVRLFERVL